MIKTYTPGENVQLSEHFNSREFKCKCGKNHEFKIDTKLIDALERLFPILGAGKCIVSSGFRCRQHDINVGGDGYGQHTKGTAADVCFFDKKGQPISTKIISCKAQDIGIPGIANINYAYSYIHLDMRTSGWYYGNEIVNYNNVTNDFYSYYGIKRDTLDAGSKENIKQWQQAALKDGFYFPSGADGIWGNECETVAKAAICKYRLTGYYNENLTKIIQAAVGADQDGLYGRNTKKAVEEYQRKNDLTADGIVGINTWKKILNIA